MYSIYREKFSKFYKKIRGKIFKLDSMECKYYGQWETDRIIEQYFPNKTNGFCIEVGAYDGIKGSNSLYFEKLGWWSCCFEPNPYIFPKLINNRNGPCFEVALSDYDGCANLSVVNFKSGIQSSLTSLKTDIRLLIDYKDAIQKTHPVQVAVRRLDTILDHCSYPTKYDFISIDSEGTELDILKGIDFSRYSFELLVVENNYDDKEAEDYLKQFGYIKDQRYKVNDFFIKG
jgi:FkbM family methyltransferase